MAGNRFKSLPGIYIEDKVDNNENDPAHVKILVCKDTAKGLPKISLTKCLIYSKKGFYNNGNLTTSKTMKASDF